MIFPSIRGRIQVWHTTLLAVIVGGLLVAFYYHQRQILLQELDRSLSSEVVQFLPHYEPVPGLPSPDRPRDQLRPAPGNRPAGALRPMERGKSLEEKKAELMARGIYLIVWRRTAEFDRTENAPADHGIPRNIGPGQPYAYRSVDGFREYVHFAKSGTLFAFGCSTSELEGQLRTLIYQLVGTWLLVVVLGFGVGWILVTKALRPIRDISTSARHIADGDLGKRIDAGDTQSELGQLTEVLNRTFAQLESSFDQQRRFTADASHELRTPISVILAKCQFALMRDRSPEKYREALQTCEGTAQHLRSLVESLLDLARVDSGQFRIQKKACNLGELTRKVAVFLGTLAEKKEIELDVGHTDIDCHVDCNRIQQVITNLVGNAIKFTQEGGKVAVRIRRVEHEAVIEVEDNGPGIPQDSLPHVFDRFYRAESLHANEHKSTGLGLSIAKVIVEAHGGSISVESRLEVGTCFKVCLPLNG